MEINPTFLQGVTSGKCKGFCSFLLQAMSNEPLKINSGMETSVKMELFNSAVLNRVGHLFLKIGVTIAFCFVDSLKVFLEERHVKHLIKILQISHTINLEV